MLNSKTLALTTSTALLAHEVNITYYTTCSLNLNGQGHIAITASGTPKEGTVNTFICNFSTTNYSEGVDDITFYGFTLPAELAAKTFYVVASYNAAAWRVMFLPSLQNTGLIDTGLLASDAVTTVKIDDDAVTTAKILDANVTTAKIADDNVTLAKIQDIADDTILGNVSGGSSSPAALDAEDVRTLLDQDVTLTGHVTGTATQTFATGDTSISTTISNNTITVAMCTNTVNTDLVTIPISLESNALTAGDAYIAVKVPYACTVEEWGFSVTSLIEATDNATISLYNTAGTLMGSSSVTVTKNTKPSTSAAGGSFFNSSSITSNNSVSTGNIFYIRVQKTTAGGQGFANIKIKRA